MLQTAEGHEPKTFNDFTRISIKGKKLSSATVSKRIDELVASAVLKEVIVRSKSGRRVIAYRTTDKGKRVVVLAKELQDSLTVSKVK
jgi:DNA-binding HxlR family transcriptional regulator